MSFAPSLIRIPRSAGFLVTRGSNTHWGCHVLCPQPIFLALPNKEIQVKEYLLLRLRCGAKVWIFLQSPDCWGIVKLKAQKAHSSKQQRPKERFRLLSSRYTGVKRLDPLHFLTDSYEVAKGEKILGLERKCPKGNQNTWPLKTR